jgi:hypothetical protein
MSELIREDLPEIVLEVFPNTGHHIFKFPLRDFYQPADKELKTKLEQRRINDPMLMKLAKDNRGPFLPWSEYVPWVRYQYDFEGPNNPIIRIAVDSTLAEAGDGFIYNVEELSVAPADSDSVSPYACKDEGELTDFYRERKLILESLPDKRDNPETEFMIHCNVHFRKSAGDHPVDVDLIVDLGNSRTAALLLETPGAEPKPLGSRIFPLRVIPRGTPFTMSTGATNTGNGADPTMGMVDDCAIIDSWLLLHRSLFAHLEPGFEEAPKFTGLPREATDPVSGDKKLVRSWLIPRTFVETSPALIGGGKSEEGAAKIFSQIRLDISARFYLSSPKRYVWNDQPTGEKGTSYWKMIPNPSDPVKPGYFWDLGGTFRYLMDPGRKYRDRDVNKSNAEIEEEGHRAMVPCTGNPKYPLRDAVCWFGLSLLEAAHRQINATEYRKVAGREDLPRRLRNIRVTYPTGWTFQERDRYLEQWQRAINIFAMTHLADHRSIEDGGQRPRLATQMMDEAVCSQLPILYSEIKSLFNDAGSWIELYGGFQDVTVMNLDIGGGTTDLAVIQYRNSGQGKTVNLQCKVLFKDGHPIAGDMLVKELIERVLLPSWIKASDKGQFAGIPDAMQKLSVLFCEPGYIDLKQDVDHCADQRMRRIVRLVLVPLANALLQKLTNYTDNPNVTWEPLDVGACIRDQVVDLQTLHDLNSLCGKLIKRWCKNGQEWDSVVFDGEAKITCEPKAVEACIDEVFADRLFSGLRGLVNQFSVQMLIVSGKPSELPRVRQLLYEAFPLLPQRIIHVKNYPAGEWYPFRTPEGKIKDAKTCTVVGAGLYQDICNGSQPGFKLQVRLSDNNNNFATDYKWGIIPTTGADSELFSSKGNLLFSKRDYPKGAGSDSEDRLEVEQEFENVPLFCRIGRLAEGVEGIRPAPVYKLEYMEYPVPEELNSEQVLCRIKLKWISYKDKGDMLELTHVESMNPAHKLSLENTALVLNTMMDEDGSGMFWLDNPRFAVNFNNLVNTAKR